MSGQPQCEIRKLQREARNPEGQHDLDAIALKLNTRPRKTLAYSTPAATLTQTVALTGRTHHGFLEDEDPLQGHEDIIADRL